MAFSSCKFQNLYNNRNKILKSFYAKTLIFLEYYIKVADRSKIEYPILYIADFFLRIFLMRLTFCMGLNRLPINDSKALFTGINTKKRKSFSAKEASSHQDLCYGLNFKIKECKYYCYSTPISRMIKHTKQRFIFFMCQFVFSRKEFYVDYCIQTYS